jgi:hypothetical protein
MFLNKQSSQPLLHQYQFLLLHQCCNRVLAEELKMSGS